MSPLASQLFFHHRSNPNLSTYASPAFRSRYSLGAIDAAYAELEALQYVARDGRVVGLGVDVAKPTRVLTQIGRTAVGIRTSEQLVSSHP